MSDCLAAIIVLTAVLFIQGSCGISIDGVSHTIGIIQLPR